MSVGLLRRLAGRSASRTDRRELEARAAGAKVYVTRDGRGRVINCR